MQCAGRNVDSEKGKIECSVWLLRKNGLPGKMLLNFHSKSLKMRWTQMLKPRNVQNPDAR
ncbi:hypothetical protein SLEP1_g5494 [Rubroshorea leprosula]|uniref:Uncharacterized protein n=1 Tax=Rubroshorea leprosula TaxID=152421 RepID=A0AAV5I131_9ROSI|nr:hypothetical protein SLEP1_g5494 [Rubroshorea leprosula]